MLNDKIDSVRKTGSVLLSHSGHCSCFICHLRSQLLLNSRFYYIILIIFIDNTIDFPIERPDFVFVEYFNHYWINLSFFPIIISLNYVPSLILKSASSPLASLDFVIPKWLTIKGGIRSVNTSMATLSKASAVVAHLLDLDFPFLPVT